MVVQPVLREVALLNPVQMARASALSAASAAGARPVPATGKPVEPRARRSLQARGKRFDGIAFWRHQPQGCPAGTRRSGRTKASAGTGGRPSAVFLVGRQMGARVRRRRSLRAAPRARADRPPGPGRTQRRSSSGRLTRIPAPAHDFALLLQVMRERHAVGCQGGRRRNGTAGRDTHPEGERQSQQAVLQLGGRRARPQRPLRSTR